MVLIWTKNLSVGVQDFDNDHKYLIRLINELDAMVKCAGANGTVDVDELEFSLHRLENYFLYHCLLEEKFMESINYPDLGGHKLEHGYFCATVKEMITNSRNSTDPIHAHDAMNFMYTWLVNHINIADKQYGEFIQANNIIPAQYSLRQPTISERLRIKAAHEFKNENVGAAQRRVVY
jgi:hemerythrin-like metal-binding protein